MPTSGKDPQNLAERSQKRHPQAALITRAGALGSGTRVRIDLFDPRQGLDRGRPRLVEAIWYLLKCAFFLSPLPWPSSFKCALLRLFGAMIGRGVRIKPRVNIHFPWKLAIGDYSWIGEEVFILNFEPVTIGSHCCISQRTFLCTGNHDYRQPNFPYRNAPITVEDGAWIGAQSFVGPSVNISSEAVITAGSVVTKNQPAATLCGGNPCVPIKPRWRYESETIPSVSPANRGIRAHQPEPTA